jgi:hypothetical protein
MVLRGAPPPDFRYVGLCPGPSFSAVAGLCCGVGLGTFALGAGLGGTAEAATLGAAAIAGGIAALLCARLSGPTARWSLQVPMAIVPWGVVLESDSMPRILRWAAVREVRVDLVCDMDNATPSTRWSIVTIRTDRELLGGRAPGSVALERLETHLESYAEEAACPLALDLDGREGLDAAYEANFELLLAEARRLIHSGELCGRLQAIPVSYREHGAWRALGTSADTTRVLRKTLLGEFEGPADPRPLAAILAAELGATELRDALVAFVTAPNPLLAAVARGAALRLGAAAKQVGAVDEVRDFLPATDLEHIRAWARDSRR